MIIILQILQVVDALDKLKINVIDSFNAKLNEINKGNEVSLDSLLIKIDFIEYYDKIDNVNFIYDYLINN